MFDRAKQRLSNQEMVRQINIEDIVEKSIPHLADEISQEPVDDDWRTRFFNKAQDISSQEMQEIWAKILAEEVSGPGKISFRTLEIISNLSKKEAEKFQIACSLVSNNSSIYKIKNATALEEFGIKYPDLMMLRETGLLHDSDNLGANIPFMEPVGAAIILGPQLLFLKSKKDPQPEKIILNQLVLTQAGKELCRMLKIQMNTKYIDKLTLYLEQNYAVSKQQFSAK